jgi:hypothetical protein
MNRTVQESRSKCLSPRDPVALREKSPTPKPLKTTPDCDFNCFPPASPKADTVPGKQKSPRRALLKHLILLIQTGAGDEIRTHDPNLGKVMLYP